MERRQKFYYLDYSEDIQYAKRIYKIIQNIADNETKKNINIPVSIFFKKMKWSNQVFNDRKSIMHIDSKLITFEQSLNILQQLNYFKSFKIDGYEYFEEDYSIQDKLKIVFCIFEIDTKFDFDLAIKNSNYQPIKGRKQILTDLMIHTYKTKLKVDYDQLLQGIPKTLPYKEYANTFIQKLEKEWIRKYEIMIGTKADIVIIPNYTFESIYDESINREDDIMSDLYITERTVAFYGFTSNEIANRKKNDYYMKYDLAKKWADPETDRGHFISHAIGGDIYTNIFPQRRDINRGLSERGKVYREMERFLTKNQDTFCFSRPIYFDFSERPYLIEYGILNKNFDFWLETFENV